VRRGYSNRDCEDLSAIIVPRRALRAELAAVDGRGDDCHRGAPKFILTEIGGVGGGGSVPHCPEQGRPSQSGRTPISVRMIHVNDGGQAVIGNVKTPRSARKQAPREEGFTVEAAASGLGIEPIEALVRMGYLPDALQQDVSAVQKAVVRCRVHAVTAFQRRPGGLQTGFQA
jgi:hypothetical protein